jgi:hypothetical protein
MSLTLIASWYLFGVAVAILGIKYQHGQITVGDFFLSFVYGLLGPVVALILLFVLAQKRGMLDFLDDKLF